MRKSKNCNLIAVQKFSSPLCEGGLGKNNTGSMPHRLSFRRALASQRVFEKGLRKEYNFSTDI
jgi:hypothetical protein